MFLRTLCLAAACAAACLNAFPGEVTAFPGAEGFGRLTPGGRGGKVFHVTTLADKGPGSLRAACEAEGPRIVVFDTGGTIELQSDLRIRNPFITVAGQTAPGGGVCLKNFALNIKDTHDVVIRHLRIRPGDVMKKELDAVTVDNCERLILDHCSASWGIDETVSTTGASRDITVQWCVISESLTDSCHKKGKHGYGSLISAQDGGVTYHHNLYAHHTSRNPRLGSNGGTAGMTLDFRNNVIYDWGFRAGYSGKGDVVRVNYINNWLKPGPGTKKEVRDLAFHLGDATMSMFLEGNVIEGASKRKLHDNWRMIAKGESFPENTPTDGCRAAAPFAVPAPGTVSARTALEQVCQMAGALPSRRDAVDARIIESVRGGTGGHIDSQDQVGGWPALEPGTPRTDTDGDGMPDEWEKKTGLNPEDPADGAADGDGDGHTNVEEWMNSLEKPAW